MEQSAGHIYFKNIALGCLEMVAFLPRCLTRFGATAKDAELSFLSLLVVVLVMSLLELHDPDYAGVDFQKITLLTILRSCVSMLGFYGLVALLCWGLTRKGVFMHFVTMANWASATMMLALLPALLVLATGAVGWETLLNYFLVVVLFNYAVVTFVARHALKINWVGGAFFGLANCFIDVTVLQMFSV
jgi:hypothetical protein